MMMMMMSDTRLQELAKKLNVGTGIEDDDWSTEKVLRTFRGLMCSVDCEKKTVLVNQVADFIAKRECDALFLSCSVEHWVTFTLHLVEWARIKQFKVREDREYGRKDFVKGQERLLHCLDVLDTLLKKLSLFSTPSDDSKEEHASDEPSDVSEDFAENRTEYMDRFLKAVVLDVLLIFLSSMEEAHWTSNASISSARSISNQLIRMTRCRSLKDILCGTTESCDCEMFPKGLYGPMLSRVLPSLTKDLWKRTPVAVEVFCQSLFLVEMPELGAYIDQVFSPILNLIDDYMTVNKLIGLKCLGHLIMNTSSAELRWYGRADVIFDALFQQLYSKEASVIEMVLPSLLAVLSITERSPHDTGQPRMYSRYDKVFIQLLSNMEMENQLILRRTYAKNLPSFVESLGITAVRHNKRLLSLTDSYLEQYDGPDESARLYIIRTLVVYIQGTWPRMPNHCERILKSLLKFVYEISEDRTLTPKEVKDELVKEATECIIMLKRACFNQVIELLGPMKEDRINEIFDGCIRLVLESQ